MTAGAETRTVDSWQPLAPLSRPAGAAVMTTWLVLMLMSLMWWIFDDRALFAFSGCVACLILSIPLIVGRQFDLLSPWSLVLVGGYVGYAIRGFFIAFGIDGTRTVEELYFLGHEPAWFDGGSLLVLVGLLVFTLGYTCAVSAKGSPTAGRLLASKDFDARLLQILVLVFAVVGFIAFYQYAQATGGLSLSRLSGKRTVISGLDLGTEYRSYGHLRFINTLSAVAFWLQIAHFANRRVPHGIATARGMWLVILFLNACLLPLYANTRADVLYVLVAAVVIELCLRHKRFQMRSLVIPAVIGVAIVVALTGLRQADQGIEEGSSASRLIDAFVLTHTFSDIPTTIHITKAVPDTLPYASGETVISWLAAPIPRALWPEKPIISLGPTVGILIFGNERAGIPPGLIAESYWNFGISGVLVIPLLAGVVVGWGYRRLAPFAGRSPAAAVIFAAVAVRSGIDLTSNSVGYALLQACQSLAVLLPVLWLLSNRGREPAP